MISFSQAHVFNSHNGGFSVTDLHVDGTVIRRSGARTSSSSQPGVEGEVWILPGFVDVHTHVTYRDNNNLYDYDLKRTLPEIATDAVFNSKRILQAGFTAVRECGSPRGISTAISRAIERGELEGPEMQPSDQIISGIGGLGDMHPNHLFPTGEYETAMCRMVRDPWDARNAVRRQAKEGARWVKITLSGTAANPRVPSERNDLPGKMLEETVKEAKALGLGIIAHAESTDAAERAAAIGVSSIEHGVYLSDRAIEDMLRNDVTLVPTLAQYSTWALRGAELGRTESSVAEHLRIHDTHVASVSAAHRAGVRIAVGGDAGGAHFPQGSAAQEVKALTSMIGMSVQEALKALTVNGAALLSIDDRQGRLDDGTEANMVILNRDPLQDPGAVADPDCIIAVLQKGRVITGQLNGVSS